MWPRKSTCNSIDPLFCNVTPLKNFILVLARCDFYRRIAEPIDFVLPKYPDRFVLRSLFDARMSYRRDKKKRKFDVIQDDMRVDILREGG